MCDATNVKSSMTRYVDKKIKDLEKYKKYVCSSIGTAPSSSSCWDKNGKQTKSGGYCQSPKGCLVYQAPGFSMKNKLQTWTGKESFKTLSKGLLTKWGLSTKAKQEVELASMFEKGKVIDIHVYTETKKGTGEFKLELATVKTLPDGRVSEIGYIYLKSQGWLVKPRQCKSYKKNIGGFFGKGGKGTACSTRGLSSSELDNIRKTLELYAFRSIGPMVGGSKVSPPSCKREFNCYCYMERNPGKVPRGGKEECQTAYEHFISKGKSKGYKATCCAEGAKVSSVEDVELLFGGDKCHGKVSYDKKKKEITVRNGCEGTFKCNGDILKCSSKQCPQQDDDRRRQRRRLESSDSTQPFDGRRLFSSYRSCASKCGVRLHSRWGRRRLMSDDTSHHRMCSTKCASNKKKEKRKMF